MSNNSNGNFTFGGNGICVSVSSDEQKPNTPTGACFGTPVSSNGGNKAGNGRYIGYVDNAGINVQHNHSFSTNSTGENETRPANFTVRIWKRVA